MRVVVVGLGIQGRKRLAVAGPDVVATVDPVAPGATYRAIEAVPLDRFDAAIICTPDQPKLELLRYLLARRKHVLVEKPLLAPDAEPLHELALLARQAQAACYTAYNHRFEPNLVRAKRALEAGAIGPVYLARAFYGNGTALDVKRSAWRDHGAVVLADLGSHLLDLVLFLFGPIEERFALWSAQRFENRAIDHVLFGVSGGRPALALEGALVSWRNTFTLDVFGQRGSVHVHGLCKWGPSRFLLRRRVWPSGRPDEEVCTEERADPTWALEYEHFARLCAQGGTNLAHDVWINGVLNGLAPSLVSMEMAAANPAVRGPSFAALMAARSSA